jgi:hypothetical protein
MPLDDTSTAKPFADLPNREKAAHLLDDVEMSDIPSPTGYHVLVLNYVRPRKIGSLLMPENAIKEDEFQGFVGYVLAVGPDAYADKARFPSGPWVKPGDWVAWPRMKSIATRFPVNGPDGRTRTVFSVMSDEAFTAVGINPERYVG